MIHRIDKRSCSWLSYILHSFVRDGAPLKRGIAGKVLLFKNLKLNTNVNMKSFKEKVCCRPSIANKHLKFRIKNNNLLFVIFAAGFMVIAVIISQQINAFGSNLPANQGPTSQKPLTAASNLTSPSPATGGWAWKNPLPQGQQLLTINCPSSTICYAVGENGTILKTADGGSSWVSLPSDTSFKLWSIYCSVPTNCFATGDNGTILRTTDGSIWVNLTSNTLNVLRAISCPTTSICYAVGANGALLFTNNAGNTWTYQSLTSKVLYGISCPSVTSCFVVGESGLIYATNAAPGNWVSQTSGTGNQLNAISCPTTSACYAVGNSGTIRATTNGGQNWNTQTSGNTNQLNSISCPTVSNCFVVDSGGIRTTVNGGANWSTQFSAPNYYSVNGISCVSTSSFCMAVGNNGHTLKTTDGNAWETLSYGPTTYIDINSISCPTLSRCFAITLNWILVSNDGGNTWTQQHDNGDGSNYSNLSCTSDLNCVAVGYFYGSVSGSVYGRALITNNGGATWRSQNLIDWVHVNAVVCVTNSNCISVNGNGGSQQTTNADTTATWTSHPTGTSQSLNAIACLTLSNCVAVGNAGAIVSTADGGVSWNLRNSNTAVDLKAITCPNAMTCLATGGTGLVFVTRDGGNSWSLQASNLSGNPFKSIACLNSNVCYLVGVGNNLYGTNDGGTNWLKFPSGTTNNFNAVTCSLGQACFLAGNNGTILEKNSFGYNSISDLPGSTLNFNPGLLNNLPGIYDLKVLNLGNSALTLSNPQISGPNAADFSVAAPGFPARINPGSAALAINVRCTAINGAKSIATLTFNTSDPDQPSVSYGLACGGSYTSTSTTTSGWVWKSPQPQGNSLVGVSCPTTTNCFAVGDYGTILKSTDGGSSWTSLQSGNTLKLLSIYCTSTTNCFATSDNGIVLRTTDGSTWVSLPSVTTNALYAINCPADNICYAVGNNGALLFTKNSGSNWTYQALTTKNLYGISCPSISTCFAVGDSGLIYATTSAPGNWATQSSGTTNALYGISCPTTATCYTVGASGTIKATTNGGLNWNSQTSGTTGLLNRISCSTPTVCFVIEQGRYVRATNNGGTSWSNQFFGTIGLNGINCINNTTICLAVGNGGNTVRTTDGNTWLSISSGIVNTVKSISCPSTSVCFGIAGDNAIVVSTDGGNNWAIQHTDGSDTIYNNISCASELVCLAVGYLNGSVVNAIYGQALITTNGGATWGTQRVADYVNLKAVSCVTITFCLSVNGNGSSQNTTTAGTTTTWVRHNTGTSQSLNAVTCLNLSNCIAVGNAGAIVRTQDGGNTWSLSSSNTTADLKAISCPSATTCYVTGGRGVILVTNDGGNSWSVQASSLSTSNFQGIACLNTSNCYVVGSNGVIFSTSDSGSNWLQILSGTNFGLSTITCPFGIACFIGGDSGTVLAKAGNIPPTFLAFLTQPVGGTAGSLLSTQPVVTARNLNGSLNTTYNGPVTLAIKAGTGLPGANLLNTRTVNAVNGVAVFTNLAIDRPGSNYQLVASVDGSSLKVESSQFSIADAIYGYSKEPAMFSDFDKDDLYTRQSSITYPGGNSVDLQFIIGRYYGLVNADKHLIDSDCAEPCISPESDAKVINRKLHDTKAVLYLWVPEGKNVGLLNLTITVKNGNNFSRTINKTLWPSGTTGLYTLEIPFDLLFFPDACKTRGAGIFKDCLRNASMSNFGTGSEADLPEIEAVANKISITNQSGSTPISVTDGYLFLNGVRPVLLMAGFDPQLVEKKEKDTTDTWGSTGSDPTNNNWINWLTEAGIPNWNPSRDGTKSIADQQEYLGNGYQFLGKVYGAKRINIVAHSMGGLISRQFLIDNFDLNGINKVDKLITIDTPNTGVVIANLAFNLGWINLGSLPAVHDLGAKYLAYFNYGNNPLVTKPWGNDDPKSHIFFTMVNMGQTVLGHFLAVNNDGIVEDVSGFGSSYPQNPFESDINNNFWSNLPALYATSSSPFDCNLRNVPLVIATCHVYATHSPDIMNWVKDSKAGIFNYSANQVSLLSPNINQAKSNNKELAQPSAASSAADEVDAAPTIFTTSGPVTATGTITVPLSIDSVKDISITVQTGGNSATQARLETASGTIITPDQALPTVFSYPGTTLAPGNYNLILTTGTISGPDNYLVQLSGKSDLALLVNFTTPTAGKGISGKIEAVLENSTNNSPVAGATVSAILSLYTDTNPITTSLTLVDNGTAGDKVAGDGKYTALLPENLTDEFILYNVTAQGSYGGNPFVRTYTDISQARSGELSFNGTYNWQNASNGNTRATTNIDTINFDAGVDVQTSGNYKVEASLAAADNTVIETKSTTLALDQGSATMRVIFDAAQIGQLRQAGPFHIVALKAYLDDGTTTNLTDQIDDTTTIPANNLTLGQIARPEISVGGTFSDAGIEPDATGKYQKLQVTLPLDIAASKTYSYSAELRTPSGKLAGTSAGKAALPAGPTTNLELLFDGLDINSTGEDGPYDLENVLIVDPTTQEVVLFLYQPGQTHTYQYTQFKNIQSLANSLLASAGAGQSSKVKTAFITNLEATALDAANQPVSGVEVVFSAPLSGPSGAFPGNSPVYTTTTNLNGVAKADIFTANDLPGSYSVTATIFGTNISTSFNLSNTPEVVCDPLEVTSSEDSANCGTLRAAILQANSLITTQSVTINIHSGIITLTSPLPIINNSGAYTLTLNAPCDTDSYSRGIPGAELSAGTSFNGPGLSLTNNTVVIGLSITGFQGYGIEMNGNNNQISCSWIGTADGTTGLGNAGGGIQINGDNNWLGLNDSKGNIISGNSGVGINIVNGKNNKAYNNWVGLQKDGISPLKNGGKGLYVEPGGQIELAKGNRIRS